MKIWLVSNLVGQHLFKAVSVATLICAKRIGFGLRSCFCTAKLVL